MGGTRGGAHPADRHTDTQRHSRYRAEGQWVVPEAGHTLQTDIQRHSRYRAESQWVVPEAGHTLQTDTQTHSVTVDTEQRASGWYQRRGTSCRQTHRHTQRHSRYRAESQWVVPEAGHTLQTDIQRHSRYRAESQWVVPEAGHTLQTDIQRHSRYRAESQWVVPEVGHILQTDTQTHSVTVDTEQRASGWYQRWGTSCRQTHRHTASQ